MSYLKALRSNGAREQCAPLPLPERSLLIAIIQRAVNDYCGSQEKLAREAAEWIFADSDQHGKEAFSFQWICEHVDIDHTLISRAIENMTIQK